MFFIFLLFFMFFLAPEGVFCLSYANMDGVPTQTAGTSELLASDWNTYVRDNFDSIKFGHVVCTSSTRPTGIAEGTMIYETDTNKVLVYNGSSWVEVNDLDNAGGASNGLNTGYRYETTVYFTSSGTFSKASYPYLRAIRVKCQGGGGGGGAATTAASGGGGGAGGGYVEAFITDIAGLASSVTVTIGSGGAAEGAGGNSSFGASIVGNGGGGGRGSGADGQGGVGGGVTGGDFARAGGDGGSGSFNSAGANIPGGLGGSGLLGGGGRGAYWNNAGGVTGSAGKLYGGGGGGGSRGGSGTGGGGAGAAGIVIVELYA
jgi:hypothetical protein